MTTLAGNLRKTCFLNCGMNNSTQAEQHWLTHHGEQRMTQSPVMEAD